jgi:hypothetical protein
VDKSDHSANGARRGLRSRRDRGSIHQASRADKRRLLVSSANGLV